MSEELRTKDTKLTYDEWRGRGLQVRSGQKAVGRNAQGTAVFSVEQTIDPNEQYAESEDRFYWTDVSQS